MAAKGQGVPEVERAYTRARELCQQVGETPELFPVLWGLWRFYLVRAAIPDGAGTGRAWSSASPKASTTRRSCWWPTMRWGPRSISSESQPRLAHTWSRPSHSTTPRSTIIWPSAMAWTLGCGAAPMWPGTSGCSAIRSRPSRGATRRSPSRTSCLTPTAWPRLSTMRPLCIATAGRGKPPWRGPRQAWRSHARRGFRSSWRWA